jgi:hypothetical protein
MSQGFENPSNDENEKNTLLDKKRNQMYLTFIAITTSMGREIMHLVGIQNKTQCLIQFRGDLSYELCLKSEKTGMFESIDLFTFETIDDLIASIRHLI